uniref:Uncharacterized protein n=1 Tax=Arundo donax TaxID=35708 RepID=A0A0A9EAT1_ARUDO
MSVILVCRTYYPKITIVQEAITCYCWCLLPKIQCQQAATYRPTYLRASVQDSIQGFSYIFHFCKRGNLTRFD